MPRSTAGPHAQNSAQRAGTVLDGDLRRLRFGISADQKAAHGLRGSAMMCGKQHYEALGGADDARDPDNLTAFLVRAGAGRRPAISSHARSGRSLATSFRQLVLSPSLTLYPPISQICPSRWQGRGSDRERGTYDVCRTVGRTACRQTDEAEVGAMASRQCVQCRSGPYSQRRCTEVPSHAATPEANRRRGATANRVLTILKAALNDAYHEGRVPTNEGWQRVKACRQVDSARIRYLTDDQARRLVNACSAEFRALVIGALMTGCRYSELVALVAEDFECGFRNADGSDQQKRETSSHRLIGRGAASFSSANV